MIHPDILSRARSALKIAQTVSTTDLYAMVAEIDELHARLAVTAAERDKLRQQVERLIQYTAEQASWCPPHDKCIAVGTEDRIPACARCIRRWLDALAALKEDDNETTE
jgi:hypothetical protein